MIGGFRRIVGLVPTVTTVPAALAGGYLGTLTLASRRHRPGSVTDRSVRFAFVVPAHNEAFGISDTIASLRAVDYPRHAFRVVVIADNCTDDTAAVARSAGAQVLERHDDMRRSKGFALSDVLPRLLDDPALDALVIVDADSVVSKNILAAAAGRIASGEHALQVRHGVRNADDSWRTELLAVAFACFHDVRSAAREEWKLSCGLRGNGMVFTREALTAAPHRASSLVEDLEHGFDLADVGIRVAYVGEASVLAEMPNTETASGSQRDRWEKGRAQFRPRAWSTLRRGIRSGDRVLVDLAADALVPPLGTVAAMTVGSVGVAVVAKVVRRRWDSSAVMATIALAGLSLHVAEGWRVSGTGRRGLAALTHVPGYVIWKLRRRGSRGSESTTGVDGDVWIRTTRNSESTDSPSGSGGEPPMKPSDEECAS